MSDEHHNNMGPVMVCLHRIQTVQLFQIIFLFAGCNIGNSETKVNYFSPLLFSFSHTHKESEMFLTLFSSLKKLIIFRWLLLQLFRLRNLGT